MRPDLPRRQRYGEGQEAPEGWLLRGCVWGMVAALHIGGMMLMLAAPSPPAPKAFAPAETDATKLQIRFIEPSAVPLPAPPPQVKIAKTSPPRHPGRAMVAAKTPPAMANAPAAPPSPADTPTQIIWTAAPAQPSYVPGAGVLRGDISMDGSKVKLSGGDRIKGAPTLHMVDPRSQGIAGVVRFIGGLTGAVDKHCLDLAAWQGMTPEERIRNRVDDAAMKQVEDNYNCSVPRGRPAGG